MKKIFILLLCLLLAGLLCFNVSAHSGGTDSAGGHTNHATGEYHYHHGHPAHQHPNGICPYRYNNATISDARKNNNYSRDDNHSLSINKDGHQQVYNGFFILIPILICAGLFTSVKICNKVKSHRKNKLKTIKEFRNYDYYFKIYAYIAPEKLVNIPYGTYIKNGLPVTSGHGKYGLYTIYVTDKGKCYHQLATCTKASYPRHILHMNTQLKPCSKCVKKAIPKCYWFTEYTRIVKIKKHYCIP